MENDACLGTHLLFHVSLLGWGMELVWDELWISRVWQKPLECSLFNLLSTKRFATFTNRTQEERWDDWAKKYDTVLPGLWEWRFFFYHLLSLYRVKGTAKLQALLRGRCSRISCLIWPLPSSLNIIFWHSSSSVQFSFPQFQSRIANCGLKIFNGKFYPPKQFINSKLCVGSSE